MNAASKFFDIFGPEFRKSKRKEHVLEDIDAETIEGFVAFCYTGNIDLTEENVRKFLDFATRYQVDLLKKQCHQFCFEKLIVANAVDFCRIAEEYFNRNLHTRTCLFIRDNLEMVPTIEIQKLNHTSFLTILRSDKDNDDLCATRLLEWWRSDENKRSLHMPKLLEPLRLERLTTEVCSNFRIFS